MSRGITAAWDIRSEMTENRDRPEMACPYFLLPRYDFFVNKGIRTSIVALDCQTHTLLYP